ncbi:lipase member K-like isoform X1 [Anthonomus grandis grandis]|uniref:lipase member K-like isoform X1 n=1 Tax=Anthonomus grandis grandis TaxID=2921223 RepID=UPI002165C6FE|nr:lipase member K-like isoform X1 [Anthonomus grandis grandis]
MSSILIVTFIIFASLDSVVPTDLQNPVKILENDIMYYKKTLLKQLPETLHKQGADVLGNIADDCKFDPDENLDVPQIIRRHGYPSESHVIESPDGYLLRVHRIPGNKDGQTGGQPVYLQHGLMGSSADFVLNGNNTLAFYLADNGYDVWLGNARGNIYSRGHVSLPLSSPKYWNFSWHEMATVDLPATLYHISNNTGKPGEIIYIGHSMGTTMSFVLASTLPQVAKNLKLIVSLAPTVFMTHLRSPIRYLTPFAYDINWIAKYLGINELAPTNKVLKLLSYECVLKFTKEICSNLLFVIAGFNKNEFDIHTLPKIVSHDPAGASTKTLIHYSQEIRSGGNFQQFDYGPKGNMIKYGTLTPPLYKLENIKRPIYLMYAPNDILTSYIDVERLAKNLTTVAGLYKIPSDTFGHVDFIFGKNAFTYVYEPLVKFLSGYKEEDNSIYRPKVFMT